MLDESYTLEYPMEVLQDMTDVRMKVFEGPLRKFIISQVVVHDIRHIRFYLYKDHFLEAVAKWPWLLCSNLGAHLDRQRPFEYDEYGIHGGFRTP